MNAIIKITFAALVTLMAAPALASGHGIPPLEIPRIIRTPDHTIEKDITHADALIRMYGNPKSDSPGIELSSERMDELSELLQPPHEWNEAIQSVRDGNKFWFDGREMEAQRKWFQTFCKYWHTDVGFLALDNLKTSLMKRREEKLAILPLMVILVTPTPKIDGPLIFAPNDLRHEACLALSDIALECKQPDAAIYFLRLSITPFCSSETCGTSFFFENDRIRERINLIQTTRMTHSGVRWINAQ
jgi:hypothetical protein